MTFFTTEQRNQLASHAEIVDRTSCWPADSFLTLKVANVLGWSIPVEFGGSTASPVEILMGMEEIAEACLTTAFVLSQRQAAIRQLLKGPQHLKQQYLPRLASGEQFLTVGLSQLTTSRQHTGPSLRATPLDSGGYRLDGEIPWVTGADQASAIVVGATLPDASQLLVVLSGERLRGMIEPPLELASLLGSRTSLLRCAGICVKTDDILAGPTESVLGKIGGGGLDTSCLAIGLASAAISFIVDEAKSRRDLEVTAIRFDDSLRSARRRLHELADGSDPEQTLELRLNCTKLALRAAQAALMVAKGGGFIAPHPAQRWARQALFFLVWSCPRPVADGVLLELAASCP